MNPFRKAICCLLVLLLLPGTLFAGGWPNIERSLQDWQGAKQVLLRSSIADPLLSPLVQDLLEELLSAGFTVVPGTQQAVAEQGLMLDLRISDTAEVLALRRAEDGAIIAFERHTIAAAPAAPVAAAPVLPAGREVAVQPSAAVTAPVLVGGSVKASPGQPAGPLYGPLEVAGQPRSLVVLSGGGVEDLELALLFDGKLVRYRLEEFGLTAVGEFGPSLPAGRALHLDAADLDGDGSRELAAVWVEDVQGIYQGTDSLPHGWLLDEDLQPVAGEQAAFLRLHGGQAVLQKRGPHVPFGGPVMALSRQGDTWGADEEPLAWGGNLFASTPFDERLALGKDERGRLQLMDRKQGRPLPGSLLLQDLGSFAGPQFAVQLETPQYRSGFSKEDMVREEYHVLPARLTVAADGKAYTVRRGRSAGLPLLGKPSGQDRVVRVARRGNQLLLEQPFAGVDAYILDFALLERAGRQPLAVLLLNDSEDGSGRAYLMIQEGR